MEIKGKPGCRYVKGKGWQSYMPVGMKDKEYYLCLSETDKVEGNNGRFSLFDKAGGELAVCDFMDGHKYMHVYNELVSALERGIATGKAVKPEIFKEPVVVSEKGYIPAQKKTKAKNNVLSNKRKTGSNIRPGNGGISDGM